MEISLHFLATISTVSYTHLVTLDKRSDLAIQMQQTILDDNAYVFCSHLRMRMIMQSNVTRLTAHPCDYYELTADLDIN